MQAMLSLILDVAPEILEVSLSASPHLLRRNLTPILCRSHNTNLSTE